VHYGGSAAGAQETVSEIEALGGHAFAVQGDLRQVPECERVVDTAIQGLGGLDILINNAGVTRSQSIEETTEALFDEMFDLNIKGYFFCARRAVPALERSGHGAIINISSVHGRRGAPNHVAYAATKGAVMGFTQSLSIELAPRGIRVNGIGPGLIEVPRYFDWPGYTRESTGTRLPLGRVGLPPDIATVAAFLVSDGASYITGEMLYVDGGLTTRMGSL
jgi:NAD(P)-dependent dehydrogenase (short-subunit alcohol dehydrogenase family)